MAKARGLEENILNHFRACSRCCFLRRVRNSLKPDRDLELEGDADTESESRAWQQGLKEEQTSDGSVEEILFTQRLKSSHVLQSSSGAWKPVAS